MHPRRHPDLGPESERPKAFESSWGNSYNGERAAIDACRAADCLRVAPKPVLPGVVTQDCYWLSARRRRGAVEKTAGSRAHAKRREIVTGYHFSPDHIAGCRFAR